MNQQTREQKIDAARARMAQLAARFLERTDGDIESMRAGLARLTAGDVGALRDIRHLAHRMVGTGATLGFGSLSAVAQRIEKLADACAPGVMPGEELRAQLAAEFDRLGAELRELRAS